MFYRQIPFTRRKNFRLVAVSAALVSVAWCLASSSAIVANSGDIDAGSQFRFSVAVKPNVDQPSVPVAPITSWWIEPFDLDS